MKTGFVSLLCSFLVRFFDLPGFLHVIPFHLHQFLGELDELGGTKVHPHNYNNYTSTYCFGIQCLYYIWTYSQWKFEFFSYLLF